MKIFVNVLCLLLLVGNCAPAFSQKHNGYTAIYFGVPWFDDNGAVVSAHGACIIKDKDRYYLFGERHTDTSNAFVGINCYSSKDLYNWKFESIALPVQSSGKIGPNRVGERPKVMKSPASGEYIMYLHVDTLGYIDQFVGYAVSKNITGPYEFKGPLLFNGKPIKKWDMGSFQDKDGSGYILLHGGDIYKLSDDYKSIAEHVHKATEKGFESPAMFRKDSVYYFMGSGLTGWERNDNYYLTATSLKGPWVKRGHFAPEGSLTWNSQTSFVLPVAGKNGTTYMFMGDRWSFPKQASAATYVWQPLKVSGFSLSMPVYQDAWKINATTGMASSLKLRGKIIPTDHPQFISYSGGWQQDTLSVRSSDEKDASFTIKFNGSQISVSGMARPDGGYADILLQNSRGDTVLTATVDLYCQYPTSTLKFVSPILAKDEYTLQVSVAGEKWYWTEKSGRKTGSNGTTVSLEKAVIIL